MEKMRLLDKMEKMHLMDYEWAQVSVSQWW